MTATAATVVFVTFLLYLFAALSTLVRIIRTEEANATNNALFSHKKTTWRPLFMRSSWYVCNPYVKKFKIISILVLKKTMNFEEKDKEIQKRIDWISAKIRDTKFQLHQELTELQKILKEQEEHRSKKWERSQDEKDIDKLGTALRKKKEIRKLLSKL